MPHLVTTPVIRHTPRAFQTIAVERSVEDLKEHGSCFVVVPTGGGKTLILSETLRREHAVTEDFRAMVMQHTGELTAKNRTSIGGSLSDLGLTVSTVKAEQDDWDGDIVFGTTQTVSQDHRAIDIPYLTHLAYDEGHRIGTEGAQAVIEAARAMNPNVKLMVYTATPNRPDGFCLAAFLNGVSYQITYAELIEQKVLVRPRTKTISLGEEVEAGLEGAAGMADDLDQRTIGLLLNRAVHNEAVYQHWAEHASDRVTLGFCATVSHAKDMARTFRDHGVVAEAIWGDMRADLREEILERFEDGTIQVVFNCMVLTEGYDNQRISCIIGLRRFLEEITFLQALGRGLRALDLMIHPGESKDDCVYLDFTGAARLHGTLELRIQEEQEAMIRSRNVAHGDPEDNLIQVPKPRTLRHFAMEDFELSLDPKQELVVLEDMDGVIAINVDAWAGAFLRDGRWHAVARVGTGDLFDIGGGDRNEAISAVDLFLAREASGRIPRDERESRPGTELETQLVRYLLDEPEMRSTRYRALAHLAAARNRLLLRRHLLRRPQAQTPFHLRLAA
jgi:DNA repair protein RadD